jgi:hypothetical protein
MMCNLKSDKLQEHPLLGLAEHQVRHYAKNIYLIAAIRQRMVLKRDLKHSAS